MKCPTPSGYPMCETCKAAGLNVCAFDGPPLPLVEPERPTVKYRLSRGRDFYPPLYRDSRGILGDWDGAT